jgi:hypothetical protein
MQKKLESVNRWEKERWKCFIATPRKAVIDKVEKENSAHKLLTTNHKLPTCGEGGNPRSITLGRKGG